MFPLPSITMNHLLRLLICSSFCVLGALPIHSQETEGVIQLEVVNLLEINLPDLFYTGTDGEKAELRIGRARRGTFNPWPRQSRLELFKEVTDAEGQVTYQRIADIPAPNGQGPVMLFFHHAADGRTQFKMLPGELRGHGALGARLINLTDSPLACLIHDQRVDLGGGEEKAIALNTGVDERFRFTFQLLQPDQMSNRSPIKTLRLLNERMRFTAVFAYERVQFNAANGGVEIDYRPQAFRLYDTAPTASQ